jgi:hypothetical protein
MSASILLWRRAQSKLCLVAAIAALGAFLSLVVLQIANKGVCCGDDGFFAMAAKNVATGVGYASTIQYEAPVYTTVDFDPYITSGPTVILPAAVFIVVLGNRYWVPGLTVALLWLIPLLATVLILRRNISPPRVYLAATAFLFLLYALFPFHFEQWFALLGEVPASSLILLAITTWASAPTRAQTLAAAGTLFGLAVLCKMLSFLWLGAFLLVAASVRPAAESRDLSWWKRQFSFVAAFLFPMFAYELWKLLSLGWRGYREMTGEFFAVLFRFGVTRDTSVAVRSRIAAHLQVFSSRFGVPLIALVGLAVVAFLLVWRVGPDFARRAAAMIATGLVIHVSWWLAFSTGSPRYMVIALVPAAFLLSLSIAVVPGRWLLGGSCVVLLAFSVPTWNRLRYPLTDIISHPFEPSLANVNGLRVARFLDQNAGGRTVFTEWWAMVSAIEYESTTRIQFQPIASAATRDPRKDCFLVLDDRYLSPTDELLPTLIRSCGSPVVDLAPYRVFHCAATGS